MSGEADVVGKILKCYSNMPDQKDNRGRTPLQFAAKNGHLEVFKLIWKHQTTKRCKEKNPKDHMGLTPLHFAAQMGHIEICKFILKKLKQIDSTKMEPLTPLHLAAENGHLEVCKLFINDKIRDSKSKKMFDRLDDKNPRFKDGKTPLHLAVKEGHLKVCQFIIENVQDKNPKDNRKDTPLHVAAEKGHLNICELIIGQFLDKSPININPLNLYGETPLQNAFLHRHIKIYQFLSQALGYSKRPRLDALVNESLPKKSRTMIKLKLDLMDIEENKMDLKVETRALAMELKNLTESLQMENGGLPIEPYSKMGPRPGNAIKAPMEIKMMGSYKVASPKFYFMGPHVIDPHSMGSSCPKDMMKERRRQQMMTLDGQSEPNEPDGIGSKDSYVSPFLARKQ
jgi:ankyrin repeat protein